MSNDKNHRLGSLNGERGLPNVNHNRSNLIKSGIIKILALLGVVITFWLAYLMYVKSNKPENKDSQKNIQITDVVPERTFELPAQAKDSSKKNQTMNSSKPFDDGILATIDKSDAALMVSKERPVTNQASDTSTSSNQQSANTALSDLLTSTATPAQSASVLKNRDYLLAKGSFIDCVLQTRLDSTVPGMTACVVTRNIYGDTGKVILQPFNGHCEERQPVVDASFFQTP